jgi:hypothetical protein
MDETLFAIYVQCVLRMTIAELLCLYYRDIFDGRPLVEFGMYFVLVAALEFVGWAQAGPCIMLVALISVFLVRVWHMRDLRPRLVHYVALAAFMLGRYYLLFCPIRERGDSIGAF